ncbi:hypothetical protein QBC44DRAFT_323657 [Cladorrhinum sp. PSN332]|nr:hypothetical protein QBC44DRAFT_323657 [Cladorrhinum sp. PSN332]
MTDSVVLHFCCFCLGVCLWIRTGQIFWHGFSICGQKHDSWIARSCRLTLDIFLYREGNWTWEIRMGLGRMNGWKWANQMGKG